MTTLLPSIICRANCRSLFQSSFHHSLSPWNAQNLSITQRHARPVGSLSLWQSSHDGVSLNPYVSFSRFSSSAEQGQQSEGISKRRQFKETPIQLDILRYIEMIGVGIPTRSRKASLQKMELIPSISRRGRRGTKSNIRLETPANAQKGQKNRQRDSEPTGIRGPEITHNSSLISSYPPPPFSVSYDYGNGSQRGRRRINIVGEVGSTEDRFPPNEKGQIAEVALAGRSNVGKSTLLNALLYGNQPHRPHQEIKRRGKTPHKVKLPRGAKAAVSNKPGETRRLVFYHLSSFITSLSSPATKSSSSPAASSPSAKTQQLQLRLVDLPGYGFAYAKPEDQEEFHNVLRQYLLRRGKALKRILLLLDARHGMKQTDFEFLSLMEKEIHTTDTDSTIAAGSRSSKKKYQLPPIQIVLTKCDLVSQKDLARRVVLVREQLSSALRRETSSLPVMLVSARAGIGFNNVKSGRALGGVLELQKELAGLA